MSKTIDRENTSVGGVTWHSSEEDSGPDVGISVYLGKNDRLWAGEISRSLFEKNGAPFDNDMGWFLVRFGPDNDTKLIAKFSDGEQARDFIEQIAAWTREASCPTMAKTLGSL